MESLDLYCTDSDDNTLPDVPNVSPEKFNYDFPRSEHIPDIPDIQHVSTVRSKRKRRKRRILARKRNNASTYDFVDLTLDDDSTTTGHGHLTSEVMDLTSSPKPIAYFTPVENVTSDSSTMDVTFNTPPMFILQQFYKDIHSKATSVQEDRCNKMKNTSNEMSTESECESSYVYGKSLPVAVNQQSSSSCTTSYESSYVFGNSPPPVPTNSQTDDCTAAKSPEKDKSTVAVQSPEKDTSTAPDKSPETTSSRIQSPPSSM